MTTEAKTYELLGPASPYSSATKGTLGGNSEAKIYGRLRCGAANEVGPEGTGLEADDRGSLSAIRDGNCVAFVGAGLRCTR